MTKLTLLDSFFQEVPMGALYMFISLRLRGPERISEDSEQVFYKKAWKDLIFITTSNFDIFFSCFRLF